MKLNKTQTKIMNALKLDWLEATRQGIQIFHRGERCVFIHSVVERHWRGHQRSYGVRLFKAAEKLESMGLVRIENRKYHSHHEPGGNWTVVEQTMRVYLPAAA